jgi:RNA polymerase sigma factor (sigma-70 family)
VDDVERLYREHGNRLWWAVLAFAGDREVASDAVAEAFAQAIRRGPAIRSPLPWIWKAAFRIAAGELHRRPRAADVGDDAAYEIAEASPLFAALGQLSPKQRAAIVLHYYGGYRLREVAQMIGGTSGTVGVHLSRARKRLRVLLAEESEERHA